MSTAQGVMDKTLIERMQEIDRYRFEHDIPRPKNAELEERERLVTLANAAPALLAACQEAHHQIMAQHPDWAKASDLLDAAIATAEGRA